MKKKVTLALLICCLIGTTGCFPTGEKIDKNSVSNEEETIENFSIDIPKSESKSYNTEYSPINASLKKWDDNLLKEIFLNGASVLNTNEFEANYNADELHIFHELDNGAYISYENGTLHYSDLNINNLYSYSFLATSPTWNGITSRDINKYFKDEELESLDRDTTLEEMQNIVNKLGLTDISEPEIYAMSAESANKITVDYKLTYKDGSEMPKWTEEQEAYFFIYSLEYDDIPVSKFDSYNESTTNSMEGSSIMGIINQDGLVYFNCKMIYQPESEITDKKAICSEETATQAVKNKYKNLILQNPISVIDCNLFYVSDDIEFGKSYILKPMWAFTTVETVDDEEYYSVLLIDAYTGQEYY